MAETLNSPGIALSEVDQSAIAARPLVAGAALVGPTVKGPVMVPTKVFSYADFLRRFGDTFEWISGSSSIQQEYLTSMAAKSYFEQGGDSLLVVRVVGSGSYTNAQATKILASGSDATIPFEVFTIGQGSVFNSVSSSCTASWTGSSDEIEGSVRKDGSLESGSSDNYRFEIANLKEDKGTFDFILRRGDDTNKQKIILERHSDVSLDPLSERYIERVIGSQKLVYTKSDSEPAYIDVEGDFVNKSPRIYVRVLTPTPGYIGTDGKPVESYKQCLPKEQFGGFYNASGDVPNSSSLFFENMVSTGTDVNKNQGVSTGSFEAAIELLANKDEYEVNIISAPGYFGQYHVDVAEERGDSIAVVDPTTKNGSVSNAIDAVGNVNSSYAAAYYPWLQMVSATGRLVWVPASVVIPGIYKYNDNVAAPWYAPAGMTRGGVQGAVQAAKKLTKSDRDLLYDKNVNPIATLPPAGLVVYGQKTLQKKASALDRVNVRRLLIEIKKRIKDYASSLLFEQNSAAVRADFQARVNPYLESVVSRQGLYGYRLIVEELNTADVIDRNEFRARIILQPTKTIEYIYLDFTVTATGVEFDA